MSALGPPSETFEQADKTVGARIVVNGDGSPVRSYLDQRDLARWLMTLLTRGEPGRVDEITRQVLSGVAEADMLKKASAAVNAKYKTHTTIVNVDPIFNDEQELQGYMAYTKP